MRKANHIPVVNVWINSITNKFHSILIDDKSWY